MYPCFLLVSQVCGLPVPWIPRLPVPVWVRRIQTLQWLLRLPAPDPVHASHQGHAVPPERMLQRHLRQQVNSTCWPLGAGVTTQHSLLFSSSKAPHCLQSLSEKSTIIAPSLREDRTRARTQDNLKWLFMVLKINVLWKKLKIPWLDYDCYSFMLFFRTFFFKYEKVQICKICCFFMCF